MSLLMDALKRAERARQAEAERAQAESGGLGVEPRADLADDGVPTVPAALSLHPMEEQPEDPDATTVEPAPKPIAPGMDTEDSLELTPPEIRREIEAMDDPMFGDTGEHAADAAVDGASGGAAGGATGEATGGLETRRTQPRREDNAMSLSLEYGDLPLDETGATLPSMRAAQRSVQDYFDGTHSMSMSMEDMREALAEEREGGAAPAPEADVYPSPMDGDTTSRRQAQAILDARAVAPSNTARNVVVVLVLALLLGGIGGGALLFKDRLLAMIDGKSAIVVNRPPASRATPPAGAVVATAATEVRSPKVLPADERDALLRAAEMARLEEQRLAEAAAQAALAQAEQTQMAAAARAAELAAATAPVEASGDAGVRGAAASGDGPARRAAGSARDTLARAPDGGRRVELAEVMRDMNVAGGSGPLSGVKISKRRRQSPTHVALVQAFEAFQRGEDDAAMTAYQQVLAREPRNRDAMLGAAAVLMRSGSVDAAAGYYAELLRMNPRDGAAQAALIALQEDLDPASGESHVKNLLARAPEDANLHFTLGNLYAEQGRWPEAQQSYFEAYRLDDANPDYAFNLAVSLDRLVQARAAANYYRRAMELSEQRPAGFESAAAARRLAVLGGS